MLLLNSIALLALAAAPAPGAVQDPAKDPAKAGETQIPDNRPEIKAMIVELKGDIDKGGKQDREAIAVIDKLHQEFPKSGPKDRAAIVSALSSCFDQKRQETPEGVKDNGMYLAAAVSLRDMGPESAKVLMTWINNKNHRKDLALQETLIKSLGRTKDETGRKALVKLLQDDQPRLQAAAGEALGDYAEADQKVRKETFEALLKLMMESKNAYDANTADPIASGRYNTVVAPIVSSLQRLSKHEENDPQKWQAWWNKNKKEDWDAKAG